MGCHKELTIKLADATWKGGRRWNIYLGDDLIAADLDYKTVKPLILGKVKRADWLAKYKIEHD